jgi:hypothetical protein
MRFRLIQVSLYYSYGSGLFVTEEELVAVSCGNCKDNLVSTKGGEFLDKMRHY